MPRATSNKSMRSERPIKDLRRTPVTDDLTDRVRTAGAEGSPRVGRARPGRAASLRHSLATTRSQKWRSTEKGPRTMRKGVLAKGSRTGRNRAAPVR